MGDTSLSTQNQAFGAEPDLSASQLPYVTARVCQVLSVAVLLSPQIHAFRTKQCSLANELPQDLITWPH